MNDAKTICFIGSDPTTVATEKECLENKGFTFFHEKDMDASYSRILKDVPSMVIVDITFIDGTGFDVCKALRERYDGLILVLSDSDDDIDQILAFESGADDVAVKPVSTRLLLARIGALFRRAHRIRSPEPSSITVGKLKVKVNASRHEASINNSPLALTTLLFDLLWFLMKNAGDALGQQERCEDCDEGKG